MIEASTTAFTREPEARPEPDPLRFVFGGVAFDVCPPRELAWTLSDEHRQFMGEYSTSPVAGLVHVSVSVAPELSQDRGIEIRCDWSGDVAQIETARMRTELRWLGGARYAARARIAPLSAGCTALCTGIATAIISHRGGLVLHAAAIELDGQANVFIGPSGAGKTTAANHCRGARWLARDRAAIYETEHGWYLAGMAGGDPIDLEQAGSSIAPLASIWRVRQSDHVEMVDVTDAAALALIRESVQEPTGTPEATLLDRIDALRRGTRIGVANTVLGADLVGPLRAAVKL